MTVLMADAREKLKHDFGIELSNDQVSELLYADDTLVIGQFDAEIVFQFSPGICHQNGHQHNEQVRREGASLRYPETLPMGCGLDTAFRDEKSSTSINCLNHCYERLWQPKPPEGIA